MPQSNCDTGRRIYTTKKAAQDASADGRAKRCDRCKGWHASDDNPKRRR